MLDKFAELMDKLAHPTPAMLLNMGLMLVLGVLLALGLFVHFVFSTF